MPFADGFSTFVLEFAHLLSGVRIDETELVGVLAVGEHGGRIGEAVADHYSCGPIRYDKVETFIALSIDRSIDRNLATLVADVANRRSPREQKLFNYFRLFTLFFFSSPPHLPTYLPPSFYAQPRASILYSVDSYSPSREMGGACQPRSEEGLRRSNSARPTWPDEKSVNR